MKTLKLDGQFKRLLWAFLISIFLLVGAGAKSSSGIVHVRGYTKKDGTYVAPHDRTAPNHTKNDNWSTKGNVNPETGKAGTKNGDAQSSSTGTSNEQADKPAANHSNWGKIKPGMTKSAVSSVLGEPNMKTNSKWVYTDLGTVNFTSAGVSE
ncbi:MAG TPA: hypothetical protein VGM64_20880 [Lacunisphaera sp.]|jgi:hypothetical protein